MSIIKIQKRENPFAMIDKNIINDNRLSFKAKGILTYLLSKPSDWQVRVKDLSNHSTDGEKSIRSGLKELIKFGYAEFKTLYSDGNKLAGKTYVIYETPIKTDIAEMAISGDNTEYIPDIAISGKSTFQENRQNGAHSNIDSYKEQSFNNKECGISKKMRSSKKIKNKLEEDKEGNSHAGQKYFKSKKEGTRGGVTNNNKETSNFTAMKEVFLKYYKTTFKRVYTGWDGSEGRALKLLITKLEILKLDNEIKDALIPSELLSNKLSDVFGYILSNHKNKWLKERLSVKKLNSVFDETLNTLPNLKSKSKSIYEGMNKKMRIGCEKDFFKMNGKLPACALPETIEELGLTQ